MIALVALGLLAGLFFSSTFILNRAMSLAGGHWVWSACLRYADMILLLVLLLRLGRGRATLRRAFRHYRRFWGFWTIAGSIGFGAFYALICFSADHSPGWVVATTWQLTVIATPVVLVAFGRSFPPRTWLFSTIVFAGVLLVNLSRIDTHVPQAVLLGGIPVLVAAFCYPVGNQLVWEAKNGHAWLPAIADPVLDNPFVKVLLLSLGSVPFWLLLLLVVAPPMPATGQLLNTFLVAVFSGIAATSIFLFARNKAVCGSELAAVDATQSSEVIFTLLGEVLFLGAPLPDAGALAGMGVAFAGLALFVYFQGGGD